MHAFILEQLLAKGWRKGGEIYWTLDDAEAAGRSLVKRGLARHVRILPVETALEPIAEIPSPQNSKSADVGEAGTRRSASA